MILNKFARYSIILIIVIISAIHLPKYYNKMVDKYTGGPKINFSPILNDFVYFQHENGHMKFSDMKGTSYSRKEYEKLLPFTFYRDLSKWGVLPETIQGLPIDIQTIHHNSTRYRLKSSALDLPEIKLYPLFESQSDFANLTLPSDVFRITDKIEFIDAKSNKVDKEKSEKFNTLFIEKKFAFPAKLIAGNPTTRKPFDEGYFIVDNNNNVFHLKKIKGEAFLFKTSIPTGIKIRKILFQETVMENIYGFILSDDNDIYSISYDGYKIKNIELKGYNANELDLSINVNPLYYIFNYEDGYKFHCAVYDTNFKFVNYLFKSIPAKEEKITEKIKYTLFPFSIKMTKNTSSLKHFDFKFHSSLSIIGIFLSLVIGFMVKVKRKEDMKANWLDFIIILFTGIYGLIGILFIKSDIWD